jgi:hypothetical protein
MNKYRTISKIIAVTVLVILGRGLTASKAEASCQYGLGYNHCLIQQYYSSNNNPLSWTPYSVSIYPPYYSQSTTTNYSYQYPSIYSYPQYPSTPYNYNQSQPSYQYPVNQNPSYPTYPTNPDPSYNTNNNYNQGQYPSNNTGQGTPVDNNPTTPSGGSGQTF